MTRAVTIGQRVDALVRAAGVDPAELVKIRYRPENGHIDFVTRTATVRKSLGERVVPAKRRTQAEAE